MKDFNNDNCLIGTFTHEEQVERYAKKYVILI